MKTKYVSMAVIAFTFAIGSAVASMFATEEVFVKAKLTSEPDAPTQCINTHASCDNTGSQICTVSVQLQSGTATASTSGPVFTYRSGCAVVLKNTTASTQSSNIAVGSRPFSLVQN